jgi:hypothetical protein
VKHNQVRSCDAHHAKSLIPQARSYCAATTFTTSQSRLVPTSPPLPVPAHPRNTFYRHPLCFAPSQHLPDRTHTHIHMHTLAIPARVLMCMRPSLIFYNLDPACLQLA